ncbi:protein NATD1 [Megalobrama amblycephala]|uniref:protein NATD1 n=1 Tax=Megalobrama amblycephala TaxID=75352 RepID=UPI0020142055|nr:protein NATD1 [Megalobrama amblycephala]
MARYLLSRNCMFRFTRGYMNSQRLRKCCGYSDFSSMNVMHDRQNQRFTITLDCDGAVSSAVLKYTIRYDQQVELMSTEVPQSHRGKGVAAQLAKAALDFVVEENLKARISCWYIRKYVDENPHLGYQAHIEDK